MDLLVLASFVLWTFSLYLMRPNAVRGPNWRRPYGLLVRLFTVSLAIAFTFQIDFVATAFDHILGIHNLSWLVGYLFAILACYSGLAAWVWLRTPSLPRRTAVITAVTAILFLAFFPPLAGKPELSRDGLPSSAAELAFRGVWYVFLSLFSGDAIGMFDSFLRQEKSPIGRVRFWSALQGCRTALGFVLVRMTSSFIVFLNPRWPYAHLIWIVGTALIVTSVLFFALAILPMKGMRVFGRLIVYLEQQKAIQDLAHLRSLLISSTGRLPWSEPSWRERFSQPSYTLYCLFVDVMDRRSLLQAKLQNGTGTAPPSPVLTLLLQDLPPTKDWVEVLQQIRQRCCMSPSTSNHRL